MSQHDYNIANQSGLEFRADLNAVLQAIATGNSGSTEPATTYAGLEWLDTTANPPTLKRRNQANSAWDVILTPEGVALTAATSASAQRTVLGLGTSATLNVGTAANNIVQLTAAAKLPAVDGSLLTGISTGSPNAIINGNFNVNQRNKSGTVILAAGAYGHDRWKAGAGGCTYTFATSGGITTLTITAGTLMQVIEGSNLLSGSYTLQWTGTAQGRVDAGSYGATGVVGTAVAGTNQSVEFNTGTLSLVQYSQGTGAYRHRTYQEELALCQRYAYRISAEGSSPIFGVGHIATATSAFVAVNIGTMRVAPTALETSGVATDYNIRTSVNEICDAVPVLRPGSTNCGAITMSGTAMTVNQGASGQFNSAGGFLLFTAEL